MFDVFKMFAGRIIAAALFAIAGPILMQFGVSLDDVSKFVVDLLGGGVSFAVLLATLKKAVLADPKVFAARVAARKAARE